jgi:hypothetical protein
MRQLRVAIHALQLSLAATVAFAQTTQPGAAAAPSAAANRGSMAGATTSQPGGPVGPGPAAAPSVAANQGGTGANPPNTPATRGTAGPGAGAAASVAKSQASGDAPPC